MNFDQILDLNDKCVRVYRQACVDWRIRNTAINYLRLAIPRFSGPRTITVTTIRQRNRDRLHALMRLEVKSVRALACACGHC